MARDRRQKASDVFREAAHFLGEKVSFARAFPQIADIHVEVVETRAGTGGTPRHYGKQGLGEYINCSNRLCYNGGFRIGSAIRDMVSGQETTREGSSLCQGYEGSPKGRKKYGPCDRFFKWKITIEYRPSEDAEPAEGV